VIVVAESIPDPFLELAEGLSVVHVECQELAGPEAAVPDREKDRTPAAIAEPTSLAGAAAPAAPRPERHVTAAPPPPVSPAAPVMPAPLAPVSVSAEAPMSAAPVMPAPLAPVSVTAEAPMTAAPVMPMPEAPAPAPRWPADARPAKVVGGFDAQVAQQWNLEEQSELAWTQAKPGVARMADSASADGSGPATPGVSANGHAASDGPTAATNGQAPSAPAASPLPARRDVFAQALREAEAAIEHNPIGLGRPQVAEAAAAPVQPVVAPVQPASGPKPGGPPAKPAPVAPAHGESHEGRTVNHPALESLCFPKGGLSRQWQEFLDQLAATP
jgi:hypothetical protein